jgi:hypothetical protein
MSKIKFLALAVACVFMTSCDTATSSTETTNPSNNSSTGLRGAVLDPSGRGIPNAVVKLKSNGATAITGPDGRWSFGSKSVAGGMFLARAVDSVGSDSVVISKDSQVIAAQPVKNYNVELPPLYIVQRDIFGTLTNIIKGVDYKVLGVIKYPDSSTQVLNFWYNKTGGSYSKFFYVVASPTEEMFTIDIAVTLNGDTTARCWTVEFSSMAGNIQMPALRVNNLTPMFKTNVDSAHNGVVASYFRGVPRVVSVVIDSSTFAIDSLKYEWRVANSAWQISKTPSFRIDTVFETHDSTWRYAYDAVDTLVKYGFVTTRITSKFGKIAYDTVAWKQ